MTTIDLPWPEALAAATSAAGGTACRAVLVAVAAARGSVPREAGTAMVVTTDGIVGTIGGGHLEFEATRIAREALAAATAEAVPSWLVRFPLAARLGQCCGGVATLAFHVVGAADAPWVAAARDACRDGIPFALLAHAGAAGRRVVVGGAFVVAAGGGALAQAPGGRAAADAPLVLTYRPIAFDVAVFGNGHVGRALVQVLAVVPARVRWIDAREHDFPAAVPANVEVVATDTPAAELAALPAGACVVVLTHSHALDFDLVDAALARDDWSYLGLIGSASKRAQFERRLAARGRPATAMARLVCPIGAKAGITGKEPGAIAVAVAAELLARRESFARTGVAPARFDGGDPRAADPVDGGAAVAAGKRA